DEEEDLFEAIKAGATGYLLKDVQINDVPAAVRGVHEGQSLINPAMAAKLISEFANMSRKETERPPQLPVPRLTEREMEVLRLVAKGMNNREIAKQLFISENTVKNHVRNILDKLQLHSRMEAVVYAVRERMPEITRDARPPPATPLRGRAAGPGSSNRHRVRLLRRAGQRPTSS